MPSRKYIEPTTNIKTKEHGNQNDAGKVFAEDYDGSVCGVESPDCLQSIFDELFEGIDIDTDKLCNEILDEGIAFSDKEHEHEKTEATFPRSVFEHDYLHQGSVHEYHPKEEVQDIFFEERPTCSESILSDNIVYAPQMVLSISNTNFNLSFRFLIRVTPNTIFTLSEVMTQ